MIFHPLRIFQPDFGFFVFAINEQLFDECLIAFFAKSFFTERRRFIHFFCFHAAFGTQFAFIFDLKFSAFFQDLYAFHS